MAIIPKFFMEAVVALGVEVNAGQKGWIATGFLVGRTETNNPSRFTVYVITNKHVVNNKKSLWVRFNCNGTSGVKDFPMDLFDDGGNKLYSEHPLSQIDVVAIKIDPNIVTKNDSNLSFFNMDRHALTLSQMQNTGVDEGCLVYSLGFPLNLVVDFVKAPICRLGCVSRVADAFVNPDQTQSFLADIQTFPGNSGAPVINRPENNSIEGTPNNSTANLIGIISSYIPYREKLYSRQTNLERMLQEENSGLTIVHPVDRIKEVVELEWERDNKIRMRIMAGLKAAQEGE